MLASIGTGVTSAISYVGEVLSAIVTTETGELNAVLPVIGVAIGIAVVGWGIRTIKSLVWGM